MDVLRHFLPRLSHSTADFEVASTTALPAESTTPHSDRVKQISREDAETGIRTVMTMSESEVVRSMEQFAKEHPAIMAFLGDRAAQGGASREDGALWFALALGIDEAFHLAGYRCKGITMDELETAEEQNTSWIDAQIPVVDTETGVMTGELEDVGEILAACAQGPLIVSAMSELMDQQSDAHESRGPGTGHGLLILKTIIDCLALRAVPSGRKPTPN